MYRAFVVMIAYEWSVVVRLRFNSVFCECEVHWWSYWSWSKCLFCPFYMRSSIFCFFFFSPMSILVLIPLFKNKTSLLCLKFCMFWPFFLTQSGVCISSCFVIFTSVAWEASSRCLIMPSRRCRYGGDILFSSTLIKGGCLQLATCVFFPMRLVSCIVIKQCVKCSVEMIFVLTMHGVLRH